MVVAAIIQDTSINKQFPIDSSIWIIFPNSYTHKGVGENGYSIYYINGHAFQCWWEQIPVLLEPTGNQWINGPPNYQVIDHFFEQGRTKVVWLLQVWSVGSLEEYVQNLVKTWEMELLHKANIPNDYKTCDHKKFVLGANGRKCYSLEEAKDIGGGYNVFLQTSLPPELGLQGSWLRCLESQSLRNEESKLVKTEFFHDRGELLATLIKGKASDDSGGVTPPSACPFMP